MKVVDDYLNKNVFKDIQSKFLADTFPWYFRDGINYAGSKHYQFIHLIYDNEKKYSSAFDYILPILNKLKIKKLIRFKVNLTTPKEKQFPYDFHSDYTDSKITTSIFYLNTTNGGTIFEDGKVIDGIENRLLTFPCHMIHTALSHTDEKRRVVMNINYEK